MIVGNTIELMQQSSASNFSYQNFKPKWHVVLEDYGTSFSGVPPSHHDAAGRELTKIEVDGRRINLLTSEGLPTEEIESPNSSANNKVKSSAKQPRLSWI